MSILHRKSLLLSVPAVAAALALLFAGSSQAAPASSVIKPAPAGVAAAKPASGAAVSDPRAARPAIGALAYLAAPVQTSPPNGVIFDHYPRTTTLTWRAVPGAARYIVSMQYCSPAGCDDWAVSYTPVSVTTPAHSFNFVGAQPGRWYVYAVDSSGVGGYGSPWSNFRYTI